MSASSSTAFWTSDPETVFTTVATRPGEFSMLMSSLVDPAAPSRAVYNYVSAFKDRFLGRGGVIRLSGRAAGFDNFEKVAIQSGIVETLFELARNTDKAMERVFTAYFAAESLWKLIVIGTLKEKEELLTSYMEHDVVKFCLDAIKGGTFISYRVIGMIGLRVLTQECFLANRLTLGETSEVVRTCCECILLGSTLWVKQLRDPAKTWQSLFCFGNINATPRKAAKYAPRYYATHQENAIWTIHELLSRHPLPEQVYYNDLVKKDPTILDLLLRCSNVPREPQYAELEVDSSALTALVLLVNLPAEIMPGLKANAPNDTVRKRLDERWDSVMEGAGLLASRPGWCQRFLNVWKRLKAEKVNDLGCWLMEAQEQYHAPMPFEDEALDRVVHYRGGSHISTAAFGHSFSTLGIAKVSLLRLVTTMAHASERNLGISNQDLLNLLQITEGVCQPEIEFDESSEDPNHITEFEESHQSSFSKPTLENIHGETNHEEIVQINDMVIEGPTSHIRLLVSLAKRGVLDEVARWTHLPTGVTLPGGLTKLKRLVSEGEIKRSLSVCLKIIAKRREEGNVCFRDDKDINEARFEYWSAAQLSAALVEFDDVTQRKYRQAVVGAKKELVLNLGNVAEMSLGLQYFDRALVFASTAVDFAAKCSGVDEVEQKVREKNERRVKRAEEGIAKRDA